MNRLWIPVLLALLLTMAPFRSGVAQWTVKPLSAGCGSPVTGFANGFTCEAIAILLESGSSRALECVARSQGVRVIDGVNVLPPARVDSVTCTTLREPVFTNGPYAIVVGQPPVYIGFGTRPTGAVASPQSWQGFVWVTDAGGGSEISACARMLYPASIWAPGKERCPSAVEP